MRGRLALLGPAFVAAVAYIDPGNFATNIAGGAKYGFLLVWVIVAANLMAMLVQYLSAKVGIATGRTCRSCAVPTCRGRPPSACGCRPRSSRSRPTWPSSSARRSRSTCCSASPAFAAGLITAAVAFGILALQQRGYRRFELAIAGFLGIVCLGFLYDLSQVRSTPARCSAGSSPASRAPTASCSRSASSARP